MMAYGSEKSEMAEWGGKRDGAGRPPLPDNLRRLTVLLPEWQVEALDDEAERTGRTRNEVLRELVARQLKRPKGKNG